MKVTIINIEADEQSYIVDGNKKIAVNGYFVTARIKFCDKDSVLNIETITVKTNSGPSQSELIGIRKQIAALFGKKLTEV